MVLIIEGQRIEKQPTSISALERLFPRLAARSKDLLASEVVVQPATNLLYVQQREFAVVAPADDRIDVLGSEDATTCHLLALRHTSSGVTALAHFDGAGMEDALARMILKICRMSRGAPEGGRLEAHVVGGFSDDRRESVKVFGELFHHFRLSTAEIHLVTSCACEANNVVKADGIHYPSVYGLGVRCKTGAVFPATFPDHGPDDALRSARHFTGTSRRRVIDVYDSETRRLVIEPFDLEPWEDAALWLTQPDRRILHGLSTSPEQEPEYFVAHIRQTLKFIVDNPSLGDAFFPGGAARAFVKSDRGGWDQVEKDGSKLKLAKAEGKP